MAATARTSTTLTHTGAAVLAASPGVAADNVNGDSFPNGGNSFLIMNNTAGSSGTVSITPTQLVDGLAVTARVYTIPANTVHMVKLGPVSVYGSTVTATASASTIKLAGYAL